MRTEMTRRVPGTNRDGRLRFAAVAGHVIHLAMKAPRQPVIEPRLGLHQPGVGDAHLVEPQFPAPGLHLVGQQDKIDRFALGHGVTISLARGSAFKVRLRLVETG